MPTADDFIEVTTRAGLKRHWSLKPTPYWPAQALCGCGNGYTQADVDDRRGPDKQVTIADLPPCKACDKSRQRRIDGRGH